MGGVSGRTLPRGLYKRRNATQTFSTTLDEINISRSSGRNILDFFSD